MARVIIQAQTAENLKTLIKLALENQLRIIGFGITKTKMNVRCTLVLLRGSFSLQMSLHSIS